MSVIVQTDQKKTWHSNNGKLEADRFKGKKIGRHRQCIFHTIFQKQYDVSKPSIPRAGGLRKLHKDSLSDGKSSQN